MKSISKLLIAGTVLSTSPVAPSQPTKPVNTAKQEATAPAAVSTASSTKPSVHAYPVDPTIAGLEKPQTATEFFERARLFKLHRLPEQARECLKEAIKMEPNGVGRKARVVLRCELPKYPISADARAMNIRGVDLMRTPDQAIPVFRTCIKKFPRFEWPYANLAAVYLIKGDTNKAKLLIHQALEINPDYCSAWMYLSKAHAMNNELAEAKQCVIHIKQADPYYPGIDQALRSLDEKQKHFD